MAQEPRREGWCQVWYMGEWLFEETNGCFLSPKRLVEEAVGGFLLLKSLVEKGGAKCGNEVCVEPLCGARRRSLPTGGERFECWFGLGGLRGILRIPMEVHWHLRGPGRPSLWLGSPGGRWRSTVVWGPASINDRRSPKAPV